MSDADLLQYPDKRLITPSSRTTLKKGLEIADKLKDIIKNVSWGTCVGMAAPQIGINRRVFIAQGEVFINPLLIMNSGGLVSSTEGCYSLKGEHHRPPRFKRVVIEYTTDKGARVVRQFKGFSAIVVQHEYDHLEGRLINWDWSK